MDWVDIQMMVQLVILGVVLISAVLILMFGIGPALLSGSSTPSQRTCLHDQQH